MKCNYLSHRDHKEKRYIFEYIQRAKLIVTKYSAPEKAIIGGGGIKAEKEHQYPMHYGAIVSVREWKKYKK